MSEAHLFFMGVTFGGFLMWVILVGIHRKAVKELQAIAIKGFEDLAQHSKNALTDLAVTIAKDLQKK